MAAAESILAFSALAAGSNTPSNVLPIVDIADLSQSSSGSTVKVTMANLFRMEATAITASAKIIDARQRWNNGAVTFVGLSIDITNDASAADSRIQEWKVGGTVKVAVLRTGDMTVNGLTLGLGGGAQASNTVLGYQALNAGSTVGNSVAIGYQALSSQTSLGIAVAIGYRAAASSISSTGLVAIGNQAAESVTTGSQSVAVGYLALNSTTTGSSITAVGARALQSNVTGVRLVALGHSAGKYETGSDALYIDNQDRTDTAGDKAKALVYGTFAAAAASQTIRFNVGRFQISNLPTSSAGLSSGDVWNDSGTLKIV